MAGDLSIKRSCGEKPPRPCVSYFTQEGDESGPWANGGCCHLRPHPKEGQRKWWSVTGDSTQGQGQAVTLSGPPKGHHPALGQADLPELGVGRANREVPLRGGLDEGCVQLLGEPGGGHVQAWPGRAGPAPRGAAGATGGCQATGRRKDTAAWTLPRAPLLGHRPPRAGAGKWRAPLGAASCLQREHHTGGAGLAPAGPVAAAACGQQWAHVAFDDCVSWGPAPGPRGDAGAGDTRAGSASTFPVTPALRPPPPVDHHLVTDWAAPGQRCGAEGRHGARASR